MAYVEASEFMSLVKLAISKDAEIEQLRVQLAGCGCAAFGYYKKCKRGDYGWSQSFEDTKNLYLKYLTLKRKYELN